MNAATVNHATQGRLAWFKITSLIVAALMGLASVSWGKPSAPASSNQGGRASLVIDGSVFSQPECEKRTHWRLDKVAEMNPLVNPLHTPYSFKVTVTEKQTDSIFKGTGRLVICNGGSAPTYLTSVGISLEQATSRGGNALGPSGQNWTVLCTALANKGGGDTAVTMYGPMTATAGAKLTLYSSDGSQVIGIDQVTIPGDASLANPVVVPFTYEIDLASLIAQGIDVTAPGGALRLDALVTFDTINARGGAIQVGDQWIRTVQTRGDVSALAYARQINKTVQLSDPGVVIDNAKCATISTNQLSEAVTANFPNEPKTVLERHVGGLADRMFDMAEFQTRLDLAGSPTYNIPGQTLDQISYFYPTLMNAGSFSGILTGWCVDLDKNTSTGTPTNYTAVMVSAYSAEAKSCVAPAGQDNLDLLNWVLNQNYVGRDARAGLGRYTVGDVQEAIWFLVNGKSHVNNAGFPVNDTRVQQIVSEARQYGEGFVPAAGQNVGVILLPQNNVQPILIKVPLGQDLVSQGVITNVATLSGDDNSLIENSPAAARINVINGQNRNVVWVGDFRTYRRPIWAQGSGAVKDLLAANFSVVFPNGLVAGDPYGPGAGNADRYAIELTSAAAVRTLLGQKGTPQALQADLTDPTVTTPAGELASMYVAAVLNVNFDNAGLINTKYPAGTLGQLVLADGVPEFFRGKTVNEVLNLASGYLSGAPLPAGISYQDVDNVLILINGDFRDGNTNLGALAFP